MSGVSGSPGSAPRSRKNLLLLAIPLLVVVGGAVASMFPSASNQGFAPEQPIPFSHKLHAGQNKIACQYCHVGVEKSRHATVPAVAVCMNCHSVVKTDSPHIKKIHEAFKSGKPIEWVRVHEIPDHAYFPHKRHIAAGLACETCHGKVQEMDRVEQVAEMNMGWCLNCHRGNTTPKHILKAKYPNDPHPEGKQVATINCSACHH